MSLSNFEAEIRKQIEAKQAQRQYEKLLDQQLILNQYKNYPLPGGAGSIETSGRNQNLILQPPTSGIQNGVAFSGDMNRALPPTNIFEQKSTNLFDDNFLRNNFDNNHKDVNQMSERERRIFLRDKERERRNQQPPAGVGAPPVQLDGSYGGSAVSPVVGLKQPAQDLFSQVPTQSEVQSKRDLMLALKAQQRQIQQQPVTPLQLQNLNQQNYVPPQPAYFQQQSLPSPSLNVQQVNQAEPTPRTYINQPKYQDIPDQQPPPDLQFGSDQDARRSLQNRQRQLEYQEYLALQEAKKGQNRNIDNNQINQAQQPIAPSEYLIQGGLNQIGDYQYKQSENKQKQQNEYKRLLEAQQQQAKQLLQGPSPGLSQNKKQAIADQIYNEVMDSQRGAKIEPQPSQVYNSNQQQQGRIQSAAVGSNRQLELQKLQMQQTRDMFGGSLDSEESKRKKELEKKKEYAAMLQVQMQMKKESAHTKFNQQIPPSSYIPEQKYQAQGMHQIQNQQNFQGYDQQFNSGMMPSMAEQFQFRGGEPAIPSSQQADQRNQQLYEYMSSMEQPINMYQKQHNQPSPRTVNSKEGYRRELEQQMKEAADKKLRQKEEKMLYEKKYDKDTADVIIQAAVLAPGQAMRRGASDITKMPKNEDERQIQARLKYQEELKQQMDEQKQRKEQLQKQAKLQEEIEEQRLQRERQNLVGRERLEIHQEGGQVQDQSKPKRQINRSQFEQTDELAGKQNKVIDNRQLFLNSPPALEMLSMPSSDIQSNAFQPSQFGGMMPPVGITQPFSLGGPQSQNTQLQAQEQYTPRNQFNVQPHRQHVPQFGQQMKAQQLPQQYYEQRQPSQPQPQFQAQQTVAPQQGADWQQQQASKMFEDQQKMIQLYQQALEQILKYRNQYFEQAMEMRENILKEREQMLEFEKLKQQQLLEMQQLQAVRNQLGSVQAKRQGISEQIQYNLDQYIVEQKTQLLSMSQSQDKMQELIRQSQPHFTVETSRVEINSMQFQQKSPGKYGSQSDEYVFGQVDEIAEQIARIGQEQSLRSQDLEVSLNSNTKLVKVPIQNTLIDKARQMQQQRSPDRVPTAQREDMLLTTWNENSIEKVYPKQQHMHQSKATSGVIQLQQTEVRNSIKNQETTIIEEELPNEVEEDLFTQLNGQDNNENKSSYKQPVFTEQSPKQPAKSEITQEKAQRKSGQSRTSSFYDKTLHIQKVQEENQKSELHKQMLRIFANETSEPLKVYENSNISQSFENQKQNEQQITPSLHEVVSDYYDQLPANHPFQIVKTVPETTQINHQNQNQKHYSMEIDKSEINIAYTQPESFFQQQLQQIVLPAPHNDIDNDNEISYQQNSLVEESKLQNESGSKVSAYHESSTHKSIAYRTASDWENTQGLVPVVFNQTDDAQQLMMMSDYQNYQVYEEQQDLVGDDVGTGTINNLKQLSPEILRTYDNSSNFQNALQQDLKQSTGGLDLRAYYGDNLSGEYIEEEIPADLNLNQEQVEIKEANDLLLRNGSLNMQNITEPVLSKKDKEMMEIAALIRKAQATTNHALEQAEQKRSQRRLITTRTQKDKPAKPIAEESENFSSVGLEEGRNILEDLDRIISNLELQKNETTFGGFAKAPEVSENISGSVIDIANHADPVEQPNLLSNVKAQWKTLQEVREARPKSSRSVGKAPLAPKGKQENDVKSRISSKAGDGSPQPLVGKFSLMALGNQLNLSDKSQDRSVTSKSPQRVGNFTQLALDQSKTDKSVISKSPQRVGQFAQMAIDSSFKSKRSNGSVSPQQRLGKFAQMAIATAVGDVSQDNIEEMSRKYSNPRERNNSKLEDQSQIISKAASPTPSLLRPVSGSYSSRYQVPNSKVLKQEGATKQMLDLWNDQSD